MWAAGHDEFVDVLPQHRCRRRHKPHQVSGGAAVRRRAAAAMDCRHPGVILRRQVQGRGRLPARPMAAPRTVAPTASTTGTVVATAPATAATSSSDFTVSLTFISTVPVAVAATALATVTAGGARGGEAVANQRGLVFLGKILGAGTRLFPYTVLSAIAGARQDAR